MPALTFMLMYFFILLILINCIFILLINNILLLLLIYQHGQKNKKIHEKLCERLTYLNAQKQKYILVGDFNLDLMKYNIATAPTNYLNAIRSAGCNAFINQPTRIKGRESSCIDHVLSNLPTDCIENHILESGVTDHFGTLSKIEGNTKNTEKQDIYFRKTKLSDQKWEEFNLHFQNSITRNIPFPQLLDANSLAEAITHTYQASIDEFMPLKRRKNNRVGKPDDRPWITAGLKASISHMFELLRISKESRSPHDYEIYKKYLNKLTHLKEKAKDKYYIGINLSCMATTNQKHGN